MAWRHLVDVGVDDGQDGADAETGDDPRDVEVDAPQSLAVLRAFGLKDDAAHVNPNGGALALGHPLGMSGARLALTATHTLADEGLDYGIATLCVGVGQLVAMLLGRP